MRRLLAVILVVGVVLPARNQTGGQTPSRPTPEDASGPHQDDEKKPGEAEPHASGGGLDTSGGLGNVSVSAATAQVQPADEKLRKQLELQQKQIQLLEKMIRLLSEQIQKAPPAGAAVEKLQTQTAMLEARTQQAAQRDQELAHAVDDLREEADAALRAGPELPATLRELFLPSRTNQSPLTIYGTLATNFEDFQDARSNFTSTVFSPHFYLLLNERFLLEVNPEIRSAEIGIESAQVDWFLNDHLTAVFGRFYSPLGFFNERLHTSWVYKTPDRPLLFEQVFPAPLSFSGLQLRGATYLGYRPVKLEYTGFVANGLSLDVERPTPFDFANLRATTDPFDDVNNAKALGGRLGLSFPTVGLIVGISGLDNGAYDRAGQHDLSAWLLDVSWHWGNWDFRFEFARTNQQAVPSAIHRQGYYAQVAYRPYNHPSRWLQRLEGVFRFDHVAFDGINLAATGLDFGSRERIPVDRNRYTFGLNYYFYPSLIGKVAYEINDELGFPERRDNGFIAQVTWGF